MARSWRTLNRLCHCSKPYNRNDDEFLLLPAGVGVGSIGNPKGISANKLSRCSSASAARCISSSVGRRYSLPPCSSTTTAVKTVLGLPARLSERKSSIVIIVLQQGQVKPERDIF